MLREVITIDGLSLEPVPYISVKPGTNIGDLVREFGGTITASSVEVPDYETQHEDEVIARVRELLDHHQHWDELAEPDSRTGRSLH